MLLDDLYVRVQAPEGFDMRWESPSGIAVQWTDGGAGEVLAAGGERLAVMSRVDAATLEECLP
jgi:hypothetical protein